MRKHSGGTVSDLKVHLVLVTKYRRSAISKSVLERLSESLAKTCKKWDCEMEACNGERNHLHLLIEITQKVRPSDFVGNLKTVSSRLIRKEFPHLKDTVHKDVFWKIGYYIGGVGEDSEEQVRRYIQQQDAPDE